jgi:hypothetical protein
MKPSKLLSLAFMVVLVLTSIAATTAASASAETLPNILPLGTEAAPLKSTSKSGESKFGSGLTSVTSTTSTGLATGTSAQGGSFENNFAGSTSALGTCTGTGLASGFIQAKGTFDIRAAKVGGALVTVILFLLSPKVTFSCGSVPVVVEGCVAGTLSPESLLVPTLLVNLEVSGEDNKIVTVLSATLLEELCQLLASVNGAATVLSSQKQAATLENFNNGSAVSVLVMGL